MVQIGDRVELIHTNDQFTRLRPGEQGVVRMIDSMGTVNVDWDSGSKLGMVEGQDSFRVVARACATCGEIISPGTPAAEVYDPFTAGHTTSRLVHADTCIPKGWRPA